MLVQRAKVPSEVTLRLDGKGMLLAEDYATISEVLLLRHIGRTDNATLGNEKRTSIISRQLLSCTIARREGFLQIVLFLPA